jgi:hypothetical protein
MYLEEERSIKGSVQVLNNLCEMKIGRDLSIAMTKELIRAIGDTCHL